MWASKSSQLIGSSPNGFEAAVQEIVARANSTLRGITGLEVVEERARVEEGRVSEYLVKFQVIFVLEDAQE
jgi:flavin-binding protein dodecin